MKRDSPGDSITTSKRATEDGDPLEGELRRASAHYDSRQPAVDRSPCTSRAEAGSRAHSEIPGWASCTRSSPSAASLSWQR